jgi:sulfate adenylyltransferase subunit 2
MKTNALKEILSEKKFDFIYGGARRDEEASRSKERVLSVRDSNHNWNPKNQRVEPWLFFNTNLDKGESFRIFPLSNWTEVDIWEYIKKEKIDIVPLYFAKIRKVIIRNEDIYLYDDDRFPLLGDDKVKNLKVRFRTLGCYPLSLAVKSNADTIQKIINEIKKEKTSERSGRLIDQDQLGSMEKKKKQGYF